MRITIASGHLIDPANQLDAVADLHIADGHIAAVGDAPDGFTPDRIIDATDHLVCPGLVDLSARLREPGAEHKGTIASESRAAVAGGITTLVCPPDTDPVVDTPAVVRLISDRANQSGFANVLCLGAATQGLDGKHITEMGALSKAGCVGISNGDAPVTNALILRRIMEYAATFNLTVFLRPEDSHLADGGCMHEGAVSTRLGLPGIPDAAETVAVARDLALIAATGVRAHFGRLSSAQAVKLIGRAQYDGLPVTADISAHQAFLTELDVADFDSQCHVQPPLRTQRDRAGLREGLARNVVTALCSDHQPHEPDAKLAPFHETASGISALETLLPLALRLADETAMSLSEAIAKVTVAPATVLGIDAGTLSPGRMADVIVVDPQRYWRLSEGQMVSRGHNTPLYHWELKGWVTHTLRAGKIVFERPEDD